MAEWVKGTARTRLNFAIGVRVSCSAACLHEDMRSASGAQKKNAAEGQPLRGGGGMFPGRTPWEIPQEAFPAERECRGGCEPECSSRARDEKFRRAAEKPTSPLKKSNFTAGRGCWQENSRRVER